jgi:hypothetical protein
MAFPAQADTPVRGIPAFVVRAILESCEGGLSVALLLLEVSLNADGLPNLARQRLYLDRSPYLRSFRLPSERPIQLRLWFSKRPQPCILT